jgi:1-acyl-sn-glycerol-3-phosphate acyltransferase
MIRFLCLNAFIAVNTIIFCLWAILLSLFDKNGYLIRYYVCEPWSKSILWVCGIKAHVKGQENINADVPHVFMSNHQSYFDIFALLAYLPSDFKFILKHELMKIPLLGLAMKRAGYFAIERENPREAIRSMEEVAEKVKAGTSVLVFPEGTRSIDGRLQPLKKGGFHVAVKSGCDIVPIAITNTCRIVTKGSRKINKGDIGIHFGRPISLKGFNRKDLPGLMDRVRQAILEMMEEDVTESGKVSHDPPVIMKD